MADTTIASTTVAGPNNWLKKFWASLDIEDPVADELINEIAHPFAIRLFKERPYLLDEKHSWRVEAFTRIPTLIRLKTKGHPVLNFFGQLLQRTAQEYREIFREHKGTIIPDDVRGHTAGVPIATPAPAAAPVPAAPKDDEIISQFEMLGRIMEAARSIENARKRKAFTTWYNGLESPERKKFHRSVFKISAERLEEIFANFDPTVLDAFVKTIEDEASAESQWENTVQARRAIERSGDTELVNNLNAFLADLETLNPPAIRENRQTFWKAVLVMTPNLPRFKEVMEFMQTVPPEPEQIVSFYELVPDKSKVVSVGNPVLDMLSDMFGDAKAFFNQPVDETDSMLKKSRTVLKGSQKELAAALSRLGSL